MAKKTLKEGRKKHFNVQAGKLYEIKDGKAVKKNKSCPRCKNTMAKAQNREFCGSCGYTVIAKKEE
ncbi:30S ribosomal protein S27ae [archaeon]|nr:30S ribosomal protein S27ae [archaeon]